jgi:hypothetical protein
MKQILLQLKVPLRLFFFVASLSFLFTSCKKDTDYVSEVFIKKEWKVDLATTKVVPQVAGRADHAVAVFYLMDNNELHYYIYFDQTLQAGDNPTTAKLSLGNSSETGAVLIDLQNPAFSTARESKGKITLNEATIASLLSKSIYLQVASTQQTGGLVRGQVNN